MPASGLDCTDVNDQRVISNQMIESMDTEIGRVLVEAGIATITDGVLEFTPEHANTMIVLLGDNGTYAPVVKGPFDPERAKGTVYQTGVWAPLIVAGSLEESKVVGGAPYPVRGSYYTDAAGPVMAYREAAQAMRLR